MPKKPTKVTINGVLLEISNDQHLALVIDKILASKDPSRKQETKTNQEQIQIETFEDLLRLTLKDRVSCLIRNQVSDWFTSNELCLLYEEAFGERLLQSTAGTYLSRLYGEGLLQRSGSRSQRLYSPTKMLKKKYPELELFNEKIVVTEIIDF